MMTMAGKRPEIFLTQTNDVGRLLSTISKMPIHGYIDLPRAVKIAQLSLKHRQNKNQKQRIIAFVGSPIEGFEDNDFKKLGKQLRKNDVAIDVVNFGHPENIPLLTTLVENTNKNENSHIIEINYGANIADTIITSPLVAYDMGGDVAPNAEGGEAPGATGASAGGQFAEYGGIDPNIDPELAMAIRISLEEEKNKNNQDADANKDSDAKPAEGAADKEGDAQMEAKEEAPAEAANEEEDMGEDEDYEAALEEAKRLSMEGPGQTTEQTAGQTAGQPAQEAENKPEEDLEGVINEEFLGELMQDLGVPMTDDAIKGCLEDENKKDPKDKGKDEDKKEDK
uniref:VWFA domain-containing protein n=1 Tax=Euplotes crassus TaxID=5936 RepID=A0A7S3K884_EUPCR|mmetsp:Transcript_10654/g.10505  ORF Transcript_10654/g.10505 Transcript_10654/m.10505 type:complete len:339 (+) Transcript_10654:188-1204(+)